MTERLLRYECGHLCNRGDAEERGIVEVTEHVSPPVGYEHRDSSEVTSYRCNLGDVGKNCVLPALLQLTIQATRFAESGDGITRIGE